jgi:hypothetical protein
MKRVRDMPDGVRDEDQQRNSNNNGEDPADQKEGLSKLDGGANLGHSSARVLGAGGVGDLLAGSLALGSDSVEMTEQFAGVGNSTSAGGRCGNAGGHGVESGAVRVPGRWQGKQRQANNNSSESETWRPSPAILAPPTRAGCPCKRWVRRAARQQRGGGGGGAGHGMGRQAPRCGKYKMTTEQGMS